MPDTYTSQFSGEEIDAALRAAQIISGADTPAELRKKLEIRGDTIPVSATDPTPVSEALTASGGGVNPNLLDNWYFGRPVNQRGQVEYTENGYIIDRWKSGVKKAIVANKYITLQSNGTYSQIFQPFELQLAGKVVTMSALINTHSGHNVGMLLYDYANDKSYSPDFIVATTANQWMVVSTSFRVADNAPDKLNLIFYPDRTEAGDQTVDILAAKLELGSAQTLAHKEGDRWILNEIPDYGEQLRRCTYYAEKVESKDTPAITNSTFVPSGATSAVFILPYARKRTVPAINFNDVSNYRIIARSISGGTTAFFVTAISLLDIGRTKAAILVSFNATDQDFYCFLQRSDNAPAGYAFISADL